MHAIAKLYHERLPIWLLLLGGALTLAGIVYPPYSMILALGAIIGGALLIARPDVAFACYFGAQALLSEDILLITEKLAPTVYRINLPYVGLNVFELTLMVFLIVTFYQRRGRFYGTGLDFSVGMFGLACLMGYATCVVLHHELTRLFEPRRLIHFFISYFLTVNLIRSKRSLQLLLLIFFGAVMVKSLQGVYLHMGGGGLQVKWKIRAIFTGWGDSLNFVTYLLFLAVFLLDQIKIHQRWVFTFFSGPVFYCLLFAYKRAYYVAMAGGLGILFFLLDRKQKLRFMMLGAVGVALLFVLITIAGQWEPIVMRVASIFEPTKESSANYRLVEFQNAFISIRKNPWFGIGLGGVMPMEIFLSRTNLLGVHNTYLWVAVKIGIFGFFSYMLLNAAFVNHLMRQNRRLSDPFLRSVSRAILCVFIAFCIAQLFAPIFSQIRTATWMGVFVAIGMMLPDYEREEKIQSNQ